MNVVGDSLLRGTTFLRYRPEISKEVALKLDFLAT
jgi:hypothetical protein